MQKRFQDKTKIVVDAPLLLETKSGSFVDKIVVVKADKNKVVLFDIVDDLMSDMRKNHTLRHAEVRLNIYDEEQFSYKLYNINMEKG